MPNSALSKIAVRTESFGAMPNLRSAGGIAFNHSLPPLSLYVHVPWCVRKCPYCDFNSHALNPAEVPEERYLLALEQDLIAILPQIWGRSIQTVFIGGGTPSLLSSKAMERLLCMLRNLLNLAPDIEITLEANPGTVEADRFKAYAESGVNRISLGIQSFNDAMLHRLGRLHDREQAIKAVAMAQSAVARVNLDLMYALPGQSLSDCQTDIELALSMGVSHLSLYNLTLEPNTVFAKYPPNNLPSDDVAAAMQDLLIERTDAYGFSQYEVSAYAKAGQKAQHNVNYWEFGDYIGIGPGAHGKISSADQIVRTARVRNPERWMQNCFDGGGKQIAESRLLQPEDLGFEFMLNALRLKHGVPSYYFKAHTGISAVLIQPALKEALEKGLLDSDPLRYKASELGWRFLNDLQEIFLT